MKGNTNKRYISISPENSLLNLKDTLNSESSKASQYGVKKYSEDRLEPVINKINSPITRRLPLQLNYKAKQSAAEDTLTDNYLYVACGASIDEIKSGNKILVQTTRVLPPDPVIQKIQERIREITRKEFEINGLFDTNFAEIVSEFRQSFSSKGLESGKHIDAKFLEFLFPEANVQNVDLGLIEISERNASLGEFPKLIKEAKRLLNVHYPKVKLKINSSWSSEFVYLLKQFQESYFLYPSGCIDSVTIKLLRGAKLQLLVATGEAKLVPTDLEDVKPQNFIRTIQAIINKHLGDKVEQNGKFDLKTAKVLELAQKAAGTEERGIFSKESYDALILMLSKGDRKKIFIERVQKILLVSDILDKLDNLAKAQGLAAKFSFISNNLQSAEERIFDTLLKLGLDLRAENGILKFQEQEQLEQNARITKELANRVYSKLSYHWIKSLLSKHSYKWRDGKFELNVVGLRGWSINEGSNNNLVDEWNDTIAFCWKDDNDKPNYIEYQATTDPGFSNDNSNKSEDKLLCIQQGQYRYCIGYYNGLYGAAVPLSSVKDTQSLTFLDRVLSNLRSRVKTYVLGSHPFSIHWISTFSDIDNIEKVGQFSVGAQVPKVKRREFVKVISPLFKNNPGNYFYYTVLDLSMS